MANAGDYFYIEAGKTFLNLQAPSLPSTLYAAAFTDSVTATGVGTEVADPASNTVNYTRKPLPPSAFTDSGGGLWLLTNQLDFEIANGGAWGTVISIAIVTVATGSLTGNGVIFGDVDTPVVIDEFDVLRLGEGALWSVLVV